MARITFRGLGYELAGQSLLDCLNAHGQAIASGCRAGVCQACLVRAVHGAVPARAQAGLPETFVARGLFLACQCLGEEVADGLEVAPAEDVLERCGVTVRAVEAFNGDTCALRLAAPPGYAYRAGQFVQLFRDAATRRNYSLASVPGLDRDLVLHVRRVAGGAVSAWIFDELRAGARLTISEPRGHCYYVAGRPDQGLLLLGTGTGIAPLLAIVRDALYQEHRGPVLLFHGSRTRAGLYLDAPARRLAAQHGNLRYHPCAGSAPDGAAAAPSGLVKQALREQPDLAGWRVYLCGNPRMVEEARLQTFLAGAASTEIFADPFLPSGPAPAAASDPL